MKRKSVKIGVRSVKGVLNDFVKTGNMIEAGKQVKGESDLF